MPYQTFSEELKNEINEFQRHIVSMKMEKTAIEKLIGDKSRKSKHYCCRNGKLNLSVFRKRTKLILTLNYSQHKSEF